jgi:hypothetical protein
MRWGLIGVAAALGLAGCGQSGGPPTAAAPVAANSAPANVAAAAVPSPTALAATATPPAGPSFKIAVTLTPAAARQLASLGQDVIVSADVYGQAGPQAPTHMADHMDQISLANEVRVTLPGAGGATVIQVPALDQGKLAYIQGDPQLLINVFSGQNLSADNKLDCSLFEDRLALAVQSGIQISCKLIGES